ncbi:MAG: DNA polymerase III subunit gamma/tau [Solirubrobacterales bacterium]|nr:DNA polymerase III subunit gamma/tau [Solirubrobacterales bacterium]
MPLPASVSLYRRHRPRSFDEVVGQEHVVRTLRNALEQDRVHHAYLFVGSRGTGKTSMAKILAASMNCVDGPTVTPCGVCDSCRSIADATSLDVLEMDAASNNSVDDIRDLREKVAYAPVSGRHKIYILDEAHMLSTPAWNAFLKTLEEPPPHTIFVLATTEAGKILPTVVDRCHRFDFARPSQQQIAGVLRRVAGADGIEIPDEASALIARSATGSFRDALGTLEQLVAYSGATVTLEDVLAVLGAADADLLFGAVDAVAGGDARGALHAAARLADSGRDVGRFFSDLEAHLRGLMIVQTLDAVPDELKVTAEQDERLAEQAQRVGEVAVIRLLDLVAIALRAIKDGADPRTQLELALIKAARPEYDPSLRALVARIERLEGRGGGALAPVHRPEVAATAAGRAAKEAVAAAPASGTAKDAAAAPAPDAAKEAAPAPNTAKEAAAAASSPASTAAGGPPPLAAGAAIVAATAEIEGGPAVTAVAVVEPGAEVGEPEVRIGVELDLPGVAELWPAVLADVQERHPMLHALMENARPSSLDGGELTLSWAESAAFYKRKAEDPACRDQIATAIRSVTGSSLRLAYALADDEVATAAHSAPALTDDELVDAFMREFDAEELPVEEES